MPHPTAPRLAATTLIVRDGESGLEVLLLRRSLEASFMPGAFVFPGGAVDDHDTASPVLAACDESPRVLARRLMADPSAEDATRLAGFAVAALRECFEECGLWLGAGAAPPEAARRALREAMMAGVARGAETGSKAGTKAGAGRRPASPRGPASAGEAGLGAFEVGATDSPPSVPGAVVPPGGWMLEACRRLARPLAVSALQPWSHWVTPPGWSRRFDTRFFVALAPPGQAPLPGRGETTDLRWLTPAAALRQESEGQLPLEFPTRETLRGLLPLANAAAVLDAARSRRDPPVLQPHPARAPDGSRRALLPGEPAYAEVRRLDPAGSGTALAGLLPGTPLPLGPAVWRLTAPNPGVMTGPGTNTYLLGRDGRRLVIDPGPDLEIHLDAILAACSGQRLEAVLVTHTHRDHSPAASVLSARLGGLRLIGLPAPPGSRQDPSFAPGEQPADGQWFEIAGVRLQAIHTPGHASNHVCWWLPEECMLFTGDHLMQGSTVVIDPPDGDMAAYLHSLRRLPIELPDLAWLAPGHGFLVDRPGAAVERLLAHRLAREAKVLASLTDEACSVEALVPRAYDDVPARLHPVAARSLLAHLLKLRDEGRARHEPPPSGSPDPAQGRWRRPGADPAVAH